MYKCKYFKIQELVSKQVYNKFGDFCWSFFAGLFLRDLDIIREYHDMPITINNWAWGGNFQQCGLRCNLDPLVKNKNTIYVSGHVLGKAVDMHSANNIQLFNDIEHLIKNRKLNVIRRLESRKSTKDGWVHADSFQTKNDLLAIFVA